jgi:hypothetical protein
MRSTSLRMGQRWQTARRCSAASSDTGKSTYVALLAELDQLTQAGSNPTRGTSRKIIMSTEKPQDTSGRPTTRKSSRVFLDLPDDMPTAFDGPLGFVVRKSRQLEKNSSKDEARIQSEIDNG